MDNHAIVAEQPVVWLPRDELGLSDNETKRTKVFHPSIRISNQNTYLDGKAQVEIQGPPPDEWKP